MPGKEQKVVSAFEARLLQSKQFKAPFRSRKTQKLVQGQGDSGSVTTGKAAVRATKINNKQISKRGKRGRNQNKQSKIGGAKKNVSKLTNLQKLPKLNDFQKHKDVNMGQGNLETQLTEMKAKKKRKKSDNKKKGNRTKKNSKSQTESQASSPVPSDVSMFVNKLNGAGKTSHQNMEICQDPPLSESRTERKRKKNLDTESSLNNSELKKIKFIPATSATNDSTEVVELGLEDQVEDEGSERAEFQQVTESQPADSVNSKKSFALTLADGSVLLTLAHPQDVPIKGSVRVSCLVGKINILGYNLHPLSDPVEVFSPDCYSLVTMTTKQGMASVRDVFENLNTNHTEILQQNVKLKKDLNKDLMKIQRDNHEIVILRLSRVETSLCKFIGSFKPHAQTFKSIGEKSDINKKLLSLDVVVPQNLSAPPTVLPPSLQKVLHYWRQVVAVEERPIMMVCGGKGSGKSTTNRFLLNSTLNVKGGVYHLECDVGQPEFTPPGVISLVHVTQPVLGPPFCHQRTPICAYLYGGVSPRDDPDRYLHCLALCVQRYRQQAGNQPLIVNTMGWLKDLGWQLLLDTVHLVAPSCLVQLTSADRYQNVAPITLDTLASQHRWSQLSTDPTNRELSFQPLAANMKIWHIPEVLTPEYSFKLDSIDYRNLGILSHLGGNIEPGLSLQAMSPYTVGWEEMGVAVLDFQVAPAHIMYLLNASLVALCVTDTSHAKRPFPKGPLFVPESSIFQWRGYGIVRGIDPVRRLFYIVTSLSLAELAEVNCLVKSGVVLPEHLLTQQSAVKLPYADEVVSTAGIHCKRPRRRMGRPAKQNRPTTT